jgi:tripartite-type tricarboxylate transporter receptor subunit TctC
MSVLGRKDALQFADVGDKTMDVRFKRAQSLIKTLLLAIGFSAVSVCAQTYPTKPIHIIVGFAPGGAADTIARTLGQALSAQVGQPVVVENRPGAGGSLNLEAVLRAPADGYTIAAGGVNNAVNVTLAKNLSFNLAQDFSMLTLTATVPNILVVNPMVPVQNVKELIAYAKANPGKLSFASSGSGSSIHLSGELFNNIAGVKMTHIPYKGSIPALADLVGGHVQVMFDNAPSALPHVRSGTLRALAVTTATRASAAPEIPTMQEAGLDNYQVTSWFAMFIPKKVPQELIARLNAEFVKALNTTEVKAKFSAIGGDPAPMTLVEASTFLNSEIARWGEVVNAMGPMAN